MIKIMGMLALALFAIVTANTAQSAPVAKELRTTDFSSQGAVNVPAVQKSLAVDPNNPNKGVENPTRGGEAVGAVDTFKPVDPNNPNKGGGINVPAVQKSGLVTPKTMDDWERKSGKTKSKKTVKLKTNKSGTGMVGVENPTTMGGINVPAVQKGCKAGAVGCPSDPSARLGPSPHMNPARLDPPRMNIPSGMGGGGGFHR